MTGTFRSYMLLFVGVFLCIIAVWALLTLKVGQTLSPDEYGLILYARQALIKGEWAKEPFRKPLPILLGLSASLFSSPRAFGAIVAFSLSLLVFFGAKVAREAFPHHQAAGPVCALFLLANPSLLFYTILGNSTILSNAFFLIALFYLFPRNDEEEGSRTFLSSLMMFLACLCRPEAWVIILPFWLFILRKKLSLPILLLCLALPLLGSILWVLQDYLISHNIFHSFEFQERYATTSPVSQVGFSSYPLWAFLAIENIAPWPFILFALVGLYTLYTSKPAHVWPFLLFPLSVLLLFWALATKGIIMFSRFLFLPAIFVMILASGGICLFMSSMPALWKKLRGEAVYTLLLALLLVFLSQRSTALAFWEQLRMESVTQRAVSSFVLFLKGHPEAKKPLRILTSGRRINQILWELRDLDQPIQGLAFREVFHEGKSLADIRVNWIVYLPFDMPTRDVQRAYAFLNTPSKTFFKDGVKLTRVYSLEPIIYGFLLGDAVPQNPLLGETSFPQTP